MYRRRLRLRRGCRQTDGSSAGRTLALIFAYGGLENDFVVLYARRYSMDKWQLTALISVGFVVGSVYTTACGMAAHADDVSDTGSSGGPPPPSASEAGAGRAVVYLTTGYKWTDGVYRASQQCKSDFGARQKWTTCARQKWTTPRSRSVRRGGVRGGLTGGRPAPGPPEPRRAGRSNLAFLVVPRQHAQVPRLRRTPTP
jgi:hypothetical protein